LGEEWLIDRLSRSERDSKWQRKRKWKKMSKWYNEEDEQGNILVYPAWSKKNAPKDEQSKWEVPIYM